MRFIAFKSGTTTGLAVAIHDNVFHGLLTTDVAYPGDLLELLQKGGSAIRDAGETLSLGAEVDLRAVEFLPPIGEPEKIICIGLNYVDHSLESGFKPPNYPAVFARFKSSLIGHQASIVRPTVSEQLDYEGELVAVIGKGGRHIPRSTALEHVAGYSLFNDASIRDFQFKSGQWTIGKNFDSTGAFGPAFITAEELPPGCKGLQFETHLNGIVVQTAAIDDLIFDVASLVALLSDTFTLAPGDLIVTGTPGGVGLARTPPLWMKPGDVCVITSKALGELRNPIVAES
ncbi:MAG TPA: fumarylacetoacetate hydrolase family protein [Steroidobacteraceae bacterium]|nr:fumarylacetoacetate hydrolase family protein [Steroidobacteraceae bacterium]